MASYAGNICTKNYQNWSTLLRVTMDNIRDVFFGHGVFFNYKKYVKSRLYVKSIAYLFLQGVVCLYSHFSPTVLSNCLSV